MKNVLSLTLAAIVLCLTLVGCGGASSRSATVNGRRPATYTDTYRGNVSTSRNGTVNGTNRYLDDFDDVMDDVDEIVDEW